MAREARPRPIAFLLVSALLIASAIVFSRSPGDTGGEEQPPPAGDTPAEGEARPAAGLVAGQTAADLSAASESSAGAPPTTGEAPAPPAGSAAPAGAESPAPPAGSAAPAGAEAPAPPAGSAAPAGAEAPDSIARSVAAETARVRADVETAARAFLPAFLRYEVGDIDARVRRRLHATATREFASALLAIPPRPPAGEGFPPRARLRNLEVNLPEGSVFHAFVDGSALRGGVLETFSFEFEYDRDAWRASGATE